MIIVFSLHTMRPVDQIVPQRALLCRSALQCIIGIMGHDGTWLGKWEAMRKDEHKTAGCRAGCSGSPTRYLLPACLFVCLSL